MTDRGVILRKVEIKKLCWLVPWFPEVTLKLDVCLFRPEVTESSDAASQRRLTAKETEKNILGLTSGIHRSWLVAAIFTKGI